ncbi:MAG TPA: NAD(P)/FAD-dependent oxidoreductase, partial [Methylomirabilota bacterium]|nr:NAD(P)/FAD-dependent oxidoreductase [Methylomirabilota bacterium]
MPARHLIVGGGTAGLNAIRTIREEERMRGLDPSEITLVSAERPYSRMVLPYYLWGTISESHVYTAPPAALTAWKVRALVGRKAKALDPAARTLTLDDDAEVEYDDCLIATGSRAAKAPIPGADGSGVHCFWTLDEAKDVVATIAPGSRVVMIGAGFIAFTILNAILARGAKLTIVEVAPRILPRMVDDKCAGIVQRWLEDHDVAVRVGATVTKIEQAGGRRK